MDGRSQIKVYTDERTQVHSAQSYLVVTRPSTNRARRYLTSVTESLSRHWLRPRTYAPTGGDVPGVSEDRSARCFRSHVWIAPERPPMIGTWHNITFTPD